jgi:two-component system phosphate regulon sensor histidine kinase PhoR
MHDFWWRPLTVIGQLAAVALVAWLVFGATAALGAFSVGLLAYVFHHLHNLAALAKWLRSPETDPVPDGLGVWEEVFSYLHARQRGQSRSQSQLSATLERFQRATEAIPDGIIILNKDDRIEWCNPAAEIQFGLNLERDRGQWLTYLLRQSQFTDYLSAHNYRQPLTLKTTRNREVTLSIQLVPFGDEQKLLISRDITQLERVENMRRDFVANVSHELRTPLTVVGGFLEGLVDAEKLDGEKTRRYLQIMLEQTTRMRRLVEDLLTLSRLESTQAGQREEPVNVPRLLEELFRDAQTLSAGRHKLELRMDSDRWLLGAEDELRSAFGNLISNAVRYTPPGGEIALVWENWEGEGVFSVQDTGPGIEPQHIPRLTERFYRVDRSRSRETGGTGLGLAIVKHALTRHQARLEIESEPGKGSTFSACFPARRVLPPRQAAEEARRAS